MSECKEERSERSISIRTVSDTGCPSDGKPDMGSEQGCEACAALTFIHSCRILWGDSLRGFDLTGLWVVGVDAPDDPPLPWGSIRPLLCH